MIMRKLIIFLIIFMFTFSSPLLLQNNKTIKAFSGNGSGTIDDPYQITNADELNETSNDIYANYTLMNDINLSGCENWNVGFGFQPLGDDNFAGSFDGQNNIISNLYRDDVGNVGGLFHGISGSGIVKNLGLTEVYINSVESGGLAGYVLDNGTVSNCYVSECEILGDYCGGLIGIAYPFSNIIDCYTSDGYVSEGDATYVGGLIGYVTGDVNIDNCYSTLDVYSDMNAGGLIGIVGVDFTMGEGDTYITDCYATGDVAGVNYVGGLIGRNGYTAGEFPYQGANITDCYATGSVQGWDYLGGLIGNIFLSFQINSCYATGSVIGNDDYIGGLIGYANYMCSITECYATNPSVVGDDYVGGLIGFSYQLFINKTYSTGEIWGDDYVGGLIGYSDTILNNSYCHHSYNGVYGTDYVGGLIGYNTNDIANCYSAIYVEGNTHVGGLIGDDNFDTITNCYWDNETSNQTTSDGGTGHTTDQMTYPYALYDPPCTGLYEDWDMGVCDGSSIWVHDGAGTVNDGYPYLGFQCCDNCSLGNIDWSNIIDPIGDMFQDIMGYDENLLGIFILLIFLIMTVIFGLSILIGTVALIPALFAVFQYIPPLRIIVAIILGLIFGMGLHKLFRR